jgi:hypothetical protein
LVVAHRVGDCQDDIQNSGKASASASALAH